MRVALILMMFSLVTCSSNHAKTDAAPGASAALPLPQTLEEAIASDYRTPEYKLRNKYRHPLETLNFFGLKPDMTVVEVTPGNGWYLQILAPYLTEKGRYIAASSKNAHGDTEVDTWLKAHPNVAATITHNNFNPPDSPFVAAAGTADMVLTFRNVHNWMSKHGEQAAFRGFFKALKPGGILGVVEHRADANKKSNSDSGYVKEREVIRLATKAGFKLVEKSDINANPKDTKDYAKGVWTLPPSNRHEPADDAKYAEIGESDRMTLKFIKPVAAQ